MLRNKNRSHPSARVRKALLLALSLCLLTGCGQEDPAKSSETLTQTKEEETEMKELDHIQVGDTVSFGAVSKNGQHEKEALQWRVLAVEEKKALLITEEGVDSQQYNIEAIATDWERCSLREWLNGKFFAEAFTEKEAEKILLTSLAWEANPSYSHTEGKAAEDKLFLLSILEAEKYFSSDEERLCKPAPLALDHGVYTEEETGSCPWWLRNQGSVPECAALVTEFGEVDHSGDGVYCEGMAVRPAMWIRLP